MCVLVRSQASLVPAPRYEKAPCLMVGIWYSGRMEVTAMPSKPGGATIKIAEQIIEDPVSELTFHFEQASDGTGRLRITGNLPYGNRDLIFDADGHEAGAGVSLCCSPRPSWLKEVEGK